MTLGDLSDLAAITTAIVTGGAATYYLCVRRSKRLRLEAYLQKVKANLREGEKGQKSVVHLMAKCGMSEAEILDAAFRSKHIRRRVLEDVETRFAKQILLEYGPEQNSN